MNKAVLSISALLIAAPTFIHAADATLSPIMVTATGIEFKDTEAPYASEIYTREVIEQSGANSLYEFLGKQTSVTVMPSFGNPFAQKLDMRGYGIGDGYQNIVVSIDGRRLNNIDMVPQLLSAIPLTAIERIEIIKGSGSVTAGDGATAGSINIITRDIDGASLRIASGSHGISSSSVSAGLKTERLSLSVMAENYSHDGFRDPDTSGKQDTADSNNNRALLRIYPTDTTELRIGKELSHIETTYGGSLSKLQFDANPQQNGGATYTSQTFDSDNSSFGLSAELNRTLEFNIDHSIEDKRSAYSSGFKSDYDYRFTDLSLKYDRNALKLIAGLQQFDGVRIGSSSSTSKNNNGLYLQAHYQRPATTYSAGVRQESVEYSYEPSFGNSLKDDHDLLAWDLGLNHRVTEQLTVFANYNKAFQAPDIDRFFSGGSFNTFIKPAYSKTVNIGLNHLSGSNKLKLSAFHSRLENEIYYYSTGNWLTSYNTNIDKSHKYGIELQDSYRFNSALSASLNYAYTRAVIDTENDGNGAYNGKDLPGVSPHTLSLNMEYQASPNGTLSLGHTYRSETYAANDFANDFTQKQAAYHSTDMGYTYRLKPFELFVQVNNLLGHSNGMWIRDDAIYPVNFETTWLFGIKATL